MNMCFSKSGLIVLSVISTVILLVGIFATVFAALHGLISPFMIGIIIALLIIPLISVLVLVLTPRRCRFVGDYVELGTFLCRGRFRVVEVVDERGSLRDYGVFVPIGFRAYPWVYGWGFGGNIPGGVLVFSTINCDSRWRLTKLVDDDGKEFYIILCCGS